MSAGCVSVLHVDDYGAVVPKIAWFSGSGTAMMTRSEMSTAISPSAHYLARPHNCRCAVGRFLGYGEKVDVRHGNRASGCDANTEFAAASSVAVCDGEHAIVSRPGNRRAVEPDRLPGQARVMVRTGEPVGLGDPPTGSPVRMASPIPWIPLTSSEATLLAGRTVPADRGPWSSISHSW